MCEVLEASCFCFWRSGTPDLVCLLCLCLALFDLEFADSLRKHWVLIFPAWDELSVIVLNFIFSFKMSCYCCGGEKKKEQDQEITLVWEAFYKCLREWYKHHEFHLSHEFSVPEWGQCPWQCAVECVALVGAAFYPNSLCCCERSTPGIWSTRTGIPAASPGLAEPLKGES